MTLNDIYPPPMSKFDDIRPYNDDEVAATVCRILNDPELSHAVASFKFPALTKAAPWLICPLVKWYLKKEFASVSSVQAFQAIVERYMSRTIDTTSEGLSTSGLDKLDPSKAYLFVSNHRDIAMDPAMVNWALYQKGFTTLRIAIGDNLLTKPYVSDIMRLNKSFIVNRSATAPREKLKAAKHLSSYIHHSIVEERANIWIAQREGRAKDGKDITNSAIISMFSLSKPKKDDFGQYIADLNIVPVSISYEWDPCDAAKARELYTLCEEGKYDKSEHEDIASIATGITGQKGKIHVAFGEVLGTEFENTDAVAEEINRQIHANYVLHPSNMIAYQKRHGSVPDVPVGEDNLPFDQGRYAVEMDTFNQRLSNLDARYHDVYLAGYANPVDAKLHPEMEQS
ncbi:1-acyl-sn-glycerol-3-phosphate acyltransferase [Marinibactrum halimedae]|uniref:Acyltransferase n=1 Tax=Marinibactrum halimedae TaxID=1444977 RepID=A0AA37WMZ4_9GAMM|nr:1-acyl-sn-glycerol-3-phosphate acyltransferase [Marinibactrum halimedae]MCD9457993.1 1-acyl-sn-glycerol-3-phosphate acyltransferase [Marinibactrum halimedae]GLS27619.1 acyltransferase [Marinibactrum halimedae]